MVLPSLQRLASSKFRASFSLKGKDLVYAQVKGREVLRRHALDFIRARLAPAHPERDGKQTPYRGHPVFTAQHATAACCRSCLSKWYKIPQGRALTDFEMEKIADILMQWVEMQIEKPARPVSRNRSRLSGKR